MCSIANSFTEAQERLATRRIVTPAECENIRLELMGGRMGPDPRYDGVIYRREDGSEIGLRISRDHGLTLDVLRSNDPLIRNGFRIHQR